MKRSEPKLKTPKVKNWKWNERLNTKNPQIEQTMADNDK
jgi:hypothetical protein